LKKPCPWTVVIFLPMWWGIWSKNCQAVILNSILQSKSKHIHTSSMMFQSGSGFKVSSGDFVSNVCEKFCFFCTTWSVQVQRRSWLKWSMISLWVRMVPIAQYDHRFFTMRNATLTLPSKI
jgi:hypothetical protein